MSDFNNNDNYEDTLTILMRIISKWKVKTTVPTLHENINHNIALLFLT